MSLSIEPALTSDLEPWRDACERGSELYEQEAYQEAIPFYEAAWQQGYNAPEWLAALGYCYYRVGDYDKSIALCQSLTEREPDNGEHFDFLGQSLFRAGKFAEAAAAYTEAVRLGERKAGLLLELGEARTRCGDYAGAREALEQARLMEPDSPDLFRCLADAAWGEKNWEEALSHLAKAAALDTKDAWSLASQGSLLVFLRRPREAAAAYREALRRNPEYPAAVQGMEQIKHLYRPFPLNYLGAFRRYVGEVWRSIDADETFAEQDTAFHAYAANALKRLIEWFGAPEDADWLTYIKKGPSTGCYYLTDERQYTIRMNPSLEADDWRFQAVGHEMCHRVLVKRRRSLHRHMWVQEMLAEMCAFRLLREFGKTELADEQERQRLGTDDPMPIRAIKRARRLFWQRIIGRSPYPVGFGNGIMRLGIALEKVVGWETLCRLVHCRTWDDWFAGLPNDETRDAARALLEMPEKRRFRR